MAQFDVFENHNGNVKFKWDEKKRRANILSHGFDFVEQMKH